MEMSSRQLRRRKVVRVDELMDDQQQENVIEGFITRADKQARFMRTVFSMVILVPSPTYIFASYCRRHSVLALLSLVSLLISVYTLRQRRTSSLRKLNMALAAVIVTQAYLRIDNWVLTDSIWCVPLLAAFTALVLEHWLADLQDEINALTQKKYDLRGA